MRRIKLSPEEAVDVFEPPGDELVCDGFDVGKVEILQRGEEDRWAVIKCCDGHLQAHRPQLTGLHLPGQTLQCSSHKQRHHLQQQQAHFQIQNPYKRLATL